MYMLDLDLETYSEAPLKKCGLHRYAEDLSTEITLFAYGLPDEPIVRVWDLTKDVSMPSDLATAIKEADVLWAHNSAFDRTMLATHMPKLFEGKVWWDTMVAAYQHALPGGLGALSDIFKLGEDAKLGEGKDLVQLFCKPHKKGDGLVRYTRHTHPEQWERFVAYAGGDIKAMRRLRGVIPTWSSTELERAIWDADQRMNDRGFQVDVELAGRAVEILTAEKKQRDAEVVDATIGCVSSATQRDAMLKFMLSTYGVSLPDMQKATLERRLLDDALPEPVKDLIRLRLTSASTSGKKWQTLLDTVCADGRLRGTMQYGGAYRTLRWSGRTFQPQNLPRPTISESQVNDAISFALDGTDPFIYTLLHGSAVEPLTSALRGAIVAGAGKKLVSVDLKSIEGRVLAWLAGEAWKLRAYRDVDAGVGYDMYIHTYARTFGVPLETVTKKQRQIGKPIDLALGFGGGVGGFVTFANVYQVDLQDLADNAVLQPWAVREAESFWEYCLKTKKTLDLSPQIFIASDAIKRQWRADNPNIVKLWRELEDAFKAAVRTSAVTEVGHLRVDKKGKWVRIKLPSGRYMCYPGAKLDGDQITYLGMNTYSRKWCRLKTYGGKLAENVTQAVSRDVFAHGVLAAEREGYLPVLLVHDDNVTEVPDTVEYSAAGLINIMSRDVLWALGLPLNADGFEGYRYKKED